MKRPLPLSFYIGPDVVQIARNLLGKVLCSTVEGEFTSGIIVETEAYRAPDDKACHAYANKRTPRTETMFKKGGRAYVYICYGIHHLFNVVTGPEGKAHAVLVRAVEPVDGMATMMKRRNMKKLQKHMCNGPGKFTTALGIRKKFDDHLLTEGDNPLWIEDRGLAFDPGQILAGPRVGMRTAEECSNWPWRFRVKDNKWTSYPDEIYYDI